MMMGLVFDDAPASGLDGSHGLFERAGKEDQGLLPPNGGQMSDTDATVTRPATDPLPAAREVDGHQGKTFSKPVRFDPFCNACRATPNRQGASWLCSKTQTRML
jgi:hypothetical protein